MSASRVNCAFHFRFSHCDIHVNHIIHVVLFCKAIFIQLLSSNEKWYYLCATFENQMVKMCTRTIFFGQWQLRKIILRVIHRVLSLVLRFYLKRPAHETRTCIIHWRKTVWFNSPCSSRSCNFFSDFDDFQNCQILLERIQRESR